MKRPDEYLPPEFWDEVFKPRGPMGLLSGRTALGFIPGVSQGLDAVDAKQMLAEDDKAGLAIMGGSYALGPLSQIARKGGGGIREILAGPSSKGFDWDKAQEAIRDFYKTLAEDGPEAAISRWQKVGSQGKTGGYFTLPQGGRGTGKDTARVVVREVSDAGYRLKFDHQKYQVRASVGQEATGRLEDFVEHPKLYELYPEARDWKIVLKPHKGGTGGTADWSRRTITVDPRMDKDQVQETLLHEIQHMIAAKELLPEGFGRYDMFADAAKKKGFDDDDARQIWQAIHGIDLGEHIADLPAQKWRSIHQTADLARIQAERRGLLELERSGISKRSPEWGAAYRRNHQKSWDVYNNVFERYHLVDPVSQGSGRVPKSKYLEGGQRTLDENISTDSFAEENLAWETMLKEVQDAEAQGVGVGVPADVIYDALENYKKSRW